MKTKFRFKMLLSLAFILSLGFLSVGFINEPKNYEQNLSNTNVTTETQINELGKYDGNSIENMRVWEIVLQVETADVEDAGTDDAVKVSLNSDYNVWLNLSKDDRQRGQIDRYSLPLRTISFLKDIRFVRLTKSYARIQPSVFVSDGFVSDAWKIKRVSLFINGKLIFARTNNKWLENEDCHYLISSTTLRNNNYWRDYRQPNPDLSITRTEMEQRIETLIGHSLHGRSIDWGQISGRAVEISKKDNNTLDCDLDFKYPIDWFPDAEVDVNFDISFTCRNGDIKFTISNFRSDVDAPWPLDVAAFFTDAYFQNGYATGILRQLEAIVSNIVNRQIATALEQKKIIGTGGSKCPTIKINGNGDISISTPELQ